MPRCFVTGCKSGYDSARGAAEKRHFFKPPNDASRLREWQHAIPRSDRELTSSCVVCDLHFKEEDIVKNFVHKIGGDVVVIPRDKWSLKDGALPRLFPNCPKYLSKHVQGTPCSVLISVTDKLRRTKDAHQEEKVRLHDIVEAKMMEITTVSVDASEQGPSDHAYYRGDVEDTVVYYLCGYVMHKFTKHATCHLCMEDISSATPVLASHSYLTDYRSFKQGSLKHPT